MEKSSNDEKKSSLAFSGGSRYGRKTLLSSQSSGSSSSSGSSIFGWILLIMIAINIPRFITGGGFNWSFQELIETLAGAPSIDISQLATWFSKITADWGVFNFFRDFLNLFVDLGSALVFLGAGMVQIIAYVLYFLGKIFGF